MRTFNGKRLFEEESGVGNKYRQNYLDSVMKFIDEKQSESNKKREERTACSEFFDNIEKHRANFIEMIGSPVKEYSNNIPNCKSHFIGEDDFGKLYRCEIEVLPDFWFYGILSVPHNIKKAPLVIAQHGGWGISELCSDMVGTNNYGFFTKRALERGLVVFAPQLLLWCFDTETGEKRIRVDIEFNRAEIDGKLKQLGLSITGLEVFCIRRSIDYLCSLEYVDEERIGMMGLSYGGFFSLYTAAVDARIKSVYSAAVFNDRNKIGFSDWGWKNSANLFFDAEVVALCAPKSIWIDVGTEDTVFDYKPSENEAERAKQYYKIAGCSEKLVYNLWKGSHRFDESGKGFDFFFDSLYDDSNCIG